MLNDNKCYGRKKVEEWRSKLRCYTEKSWQALLRRLDSEQSFEGGKGVSQVDIWEKKRGGFTITLAKFDFQGPFQGLVSNFVSVIT